MLNRKDGSNKVTGSTENKTPKTEVVPRKRKKRRFTAKYKLQILAEADACTERGQLGALLRREGLYSSYLTDWRELRRDGSLTALSAQKRGPKPLAPEVKDELLQLRSENEQLQKRLAKAETIVEVQKKVSELLELLDTPSVSSEGA